MEVPEATVMHREARWGCSLEGLAQPSPEPAGSALDPVLSRC